MLKMAMIAVTAASLIGSTALMATPAAAGQYQGNQKSSAHVGKHKTKQHGWKKHSKNRKAVRKRAKNRKHAHKRRTKRSDLARSKYHRKSRHGGKAMHQRNTTRFAATKRGRHYHPYPRPHYRPHYRPRYRAYYRHHRHYWRPGWGPRRYYTWYRPGYSCRYVWRTKRVYKPHWGWKLVRYRAPYCYRAYIW